MRARLLLGCNSNNIATLPSQWSSATWGHHNLKNRYKIIYNQRLISKPSQIAINVHLIITLPSDLMLRHTSCRVAGWRLKRQLIDRQGRPGNTPPDGSTWRGMFTDLTSAAITSRQRIFFKAAVNQTRQNVYHCEFSRQIQTKLQPQTCLRWMFSNDNKKNNLSEWNCCGQEEFFHDIITFPALRIAFAIIFHCIFGVRVELLFHYIKKKPWHQHWMV